MTIANFNYEGIDILTLKIGIYKHCWKIVALVLFIIFISLSHYITSTEHKYHGLHEIYRRLYYIPIILSAFWFGLKGGISCAIGVSLFYLPHVIYQWGGSFLTDDLPQTLEIVLYNIVGLVTGFLSQRQMNATAKLRRQADVLAQAEEQLRHADRLSALGKLSAGIAHEVRTPLASIKGTAEIISDKFKPTDKEHEFAKILIKEVDRLDTVVAEFLDFARSKPPELKLADINDIIKSVLKLTEHEIAKSKISLRARFEKSLPSIFVDPEQMKQVFLNLIINAVQAMPNGGTIEIESGQNKSDIVCKFADTGTGISEEQQEKLFTPFFTSKERGTGLGLAIVHGILEGHKGKIKFTTKENQGTTFIISLPIKTE